MAEKSCSPRLVPRLVSSSHIVCIVSKWIHMFPFSPHRVSCNHFHNSIVIMRDLFLKLALSMSQASFTVVLPLIFKYNESGIVDAICWKTIAYSCEYWFMSFVYFSILLTCSLARAVDPSGIGGGASGLATMPSKWPYNPRAWIDNSSQSFHTMNPFPSAGSLGTRRKLLPSFKSSDICNK